MRRICSCITRARLIALCFATLLCTFALAAHAQGCSMCRDTTAGSASEIRAGFRRAIPVLAIPAIGLFLAFFVVARRIDAGKCMDGTGEGLPTRQSLDERAK
jgi:TRAP-type C4-dicarboxylate transport system permease small subunit